MNLSKAERLILWNQYEILKYLNKDEEETYTSNQRILGDGYEYHYGELNLSIYPDSETMKDDESQQVIDILSMFRALRFSYDGLEDKEGISEQDIQFEGFDGNHNPAYMSYAQWFCVEGDRFPEVVGDLRDFNSHSPRLGVYLRMLEVWNTVDWQSKYNLSNEEIQRICEARVHPENR